MMANFAHGGHSAAGDGPTSAGQTGGRVLSLLPSSVAAHSRSAASRDPRAWLWIDWRRYGWGSATQKCRILGATHPKTR
jgi:hypothetical protein